MYSKLCRDVLRGLRYLAEIEEDTAQLEAFRETFSIKSVVISKGRAKLANMRAVGGGTSAGGGGTSATASGRVPGGGGPSAHSGEYDNNNFKSMIEGIFTGKEKPYVLELFMYFLEGNTKSKR